MPSSLAAWLTPVVAGRAAVALLIVGFVARRYWLVPLRLLKKAYPRDESTPRLVGDQEWLPDEVAEYFGTRRAELAALGFTATPAIIESNAAMRLYLQRFENGPRTTIATVMVSISCPDGKPAKLFRRQVGYDSRDAAGRRVATIGHSGAPGFPDRPRDSIVRVPEEDGALLLRLHGAHLQRSRLAAAVHAVGDPIAFQTRHSRESERWAVESGWFRDVGAFRKRTVRGAFIATWRQLAPWSWVLRRRERRVWRDLYGVATGADLLQAFFGAVNASAGSRAGSP